MSNESHDHFITWMFIQCQVLGVAFYLRVALRPKFNHFLMFYLQFSYKFHFPGFSFIIYYSVALLLISFDVCHAKQCTSRQRCFNGTQNGLHMSYAAFKKESDSKVIITEGINKTLNVTGKVKYKFKYQMKIISCKSDLFRYEYFLENNMCNRLQVVFLPLQFTSDRRK